MTPIQSWDRASHRTLRAVQRRARIHRRLRQGSTSDGQVVAGSFPNPAGAPRLVGQSCAARHQRSGHARSETEGRRELPGQPFRWSRTAVRGHDRRRGQRRVRGQTDADLSHRYRRPCRLQSRNRAVRLQPRTPWRRDRGISGAGAGSRRLIRARLRFTTFVGSLRTVMRSQFSPGCFKISRRHRALEWPRGTCRDRRRIDERVP